MADDTTSGGAAVEDQLGAYVHLSGSEQRLIANYRHMKDSAQEMLLDLSAQYRRTLPATPVRLRLLRAGH